jgi:sugar/nucleoside kinase (ribokinase family)
MSEIILLGQALIDYLCLDNSNLFQKHNIKEKSANKLDFDSIEQLIYESEIQNKDIGGCVTNTAIGLSKLGQKCNLLYSDGCGKNADYFSKELSKYKLIKPIEQKILGNEIGIVVTYVGNIDTNTARTCVFNHGYANLITIDEEVNSLFEKNNILYFSMFSLFENNSENIFYILENAKNNGVQIICDAGGVRNLNSY